MTWPWLVAFAVLWLMAAGEGLMILALAREVHEIRSRVEAHEMHLRLLDVQARGMPPPVISLTSPQEHAIPLSGEVSTVGQPDDQVA